MEMDEDVRNYKKENKNQHKRHKKAPTRSKMLSRGQVLSKLESGNIVTSEACVFVDECE